MPMLDASNDSGSIVAASWKWARIYRFENLENHSQKKC